MIPEPGYVYRLVDGYAQSVPSHPGVPGLQWRKLGKPQDFLSTKSLALGKASIDYSKEVLKGKSGVYYYVPVDHNVVLSSDSYAPAARKWYCLGEPFESEGHGKIQGWAESAHRTPWTNQRSACIEPGRPGK